MLDATVANPAERKPVLIDRNIFEARRDNAVNEALVPLLPTVERIVSARGCEFCRGAL